MVCQASMWCNAYSPPLCLYVCLFLREGRRLKGKRKSCKKPPQSKTEWKRCKKKSLIYFSLITAFCFSTFYEWWDLFFSQRGCTVPLIYCFLFVVYLQLYVFYVLFYINRLFVRIFCLIMFLSVSASAITALLSPFVAVLLVVFVSTVAVHSYIYSSLPPCFSSSFVSLLSVLL